MFQERLPDSMSSTARETTCQTLHSLVRSWKDLVMLASMTRVTKLRRASRNGTAAATVLLLRKRHMMQLKPFGPDTRPRSCSQPPPHDRYAYSSQLVFCNIPPASNSEFVEQINTHQHSRSFLHTEMVRASILCIPRRHRSWGVSRESDHGDGAARCISKNDRQDEIE